MKPTVLTTHPLNEEVEAYIAEHCHICTLEGSISEDELHEALQDVDGLFTSSGQVEKVDETLLKHAPKLKVVSNVSVGYNNFDIEAMRKHNVVGTNTPNVLDETVADLAFALILSTARRIVELDRYVKDGKWNNETTYKETWGKDVNGATLGIVGMGRIGEAIAKRAKFGFDMDVLYHNRSRKVEAEEKYGASYRSLDDLLKEADFVLLMIPLTDETYRLIGEREFKMMKDSAIFINVSRGQTVDEPALVNALQTGEIQAAGLDVFEEEPTNPDNPLLQLSNVVTVPHIGSATAKTETAMAMRAAENLVAVLTGNEPKNPVWT